MMHSSRCSCGQPSYHRQISYVRNDPVNLIDPDGKDYYSELAFFQMLAVGVRPEIALSWIDSMVRSGGWSGGLFFFFPSYNEPVVWAINLPAFGNSGTSNSGSPILPPPPASGSIGGVTPGGFPSATAAKNATLDLLRHNNKCADFIGGDAAGQLNRTKVISTDLGGYWIDKDGKPHVNMDDTARGTIKLYSQVFNDPNKNITVNGVTFTPLGAFNQEYGTNLTAQQYQELWILRGLAHIAMTQNNFIQRDGSFKDVQQNNQLIMDNCFN